MHGGSRVVLGAVAGRSSHGVPGAGCGSGWDGSCDSVGDGSCDSSLDAVCGSEGAEVRKNFIFLWNVSQRAVLGPAPAEI